MTDDPKAPVPEPDDDAGILEWIGYALEKGHHADALNGLSRNQVRELVKGGTDLAVDEAGEKPETPAPARKRASSRTRKAAEPPVEAEPEKPSRTPFLPEQQQRLEAVTVARGIIGTEHRPGLGGGRVPADVIAICDLAEFILTGLHPLTGFTATVKQQVTEAIASAPDPDDGGPGLSYAGAPTTTQEGTA